MFCDLVAPLRFFAVLALPCPCYQWFFSIRNILIRVWYPFMKIQPNLAPANF